MKGLQFLRFTPEYRIYYYYGVLLGVYGQMRPIHTERPKYILFLYYVLLCISSITHFSYILVYI